MNTTYKLLKCTYQWQIKHLLNQNLLNQHTMCPTFGVSVPLVKPPIGTLQRERRALPMRTADVARELLSTLRSVYPPLLIYINTKRMNILISNFILTKWDLKRIVYQNLCNKNISDFNVQWNRYPNEKQYYYR